MKKYRIEYANKNAGTRDLAGNIFTVIFLTFFTIIWYGITIFALSSDGGPGIGFMLIFLISGLLPLLSLVGVVYNLVINSISKSRCAQIFDNGHRATGNVTKFVPCKNNNGRYATRYKLEFTYFDENNNEATCVTHIDFTYCGNISLGKTIPIIVSGKYAIYDLDNLMSDPFEEHFDGTNTFVKCTCGEKVPFNMLYCPRCGKSMEELKKNQKASSFDEASSHKYCTYCGNKVSKDDLFCPKCGSKIEK